MRKIEENDALDDQINDKFEIELTTGSNLNQN